MTQPRQVPWGLLEACCRNARPARLLFICLPGCPRAVKDSRVLALCKYVIILPSGVLYRLIRNQSDCVVLFVLFQCPDLAVLGYSAVLCICMCAITLLRVVALQTYNRLAGAGVPRHLSVDACSKQVSDHNRQMCVYTVEVGSAALIVGCTL